MNIIVHGFITIILAFALFFGSVILFAMFNGDGDIAFIAFVLCIIGSIIIQLLYKIYEQLFIINRDE